MITQMGAESVVLSDDTKYDVWEGGEHHRDDDQRFRDVAVIYEAH